MRPILSNIFSRSRTQGDLRKIPFRSPFRAPGEGHCSVHPADPVYGHLLDDDLPGLENILLPIIILVLFYSCFSLLHPFHDLSISETYHLSVMRAPLRYGCSRSLTSLSSPENRLKYTHLDALIQFRVLGYQPPSNGNNSSIGYGDLQTGQQVPDPGPIRDLNIHALFMLIPGETLSQGPK